MGIEKELIVFGCLDKAEVRVKEVGEEKSQILDELLILII